MLRGACPEPAEGLNMTSDTRCGIFETSASFGNGVGVILEFFARLSTSGHLMPRHFLKQMGMVPETFFSEVRYSGSHDLTAAAVLNRDVEAGVANSFVIERISDAGRLSWSELRVPWQTPPFPDDVLAMAKDIDSAPRTRTAEVF